MNGHALPPSRQASSVGWTAYNALDEKQHRALAPSATSSWLAGLVPSSYRQAVLPVHTDDRPSLSLLRRIKKSVFRLLPSFQSSPYPRRSPLAHAALPPEPWPPLPSGDTVRFVLLCTLWYSSSALSSNTGKVIMNQFPYPITLTFVQFGFVAAFSLLFMSPVIRFSKLRRPTRAIFRATFPMGCFQVGGHIFSSMAIARIPVSTVHTIKALSPLFTVAAYALLFGVSYNPQTYLSLLPLTFGVMLVCSFDTSASSNIGLLCAFGSALVFVSQNIFFKKIMPSTSAHGTATTSHKLDKLNLLFYSSSMAFLLMVPIWGYSDFLGFMSASPTHIVHPAHPRPAHSSIIPYLLANGTVHFGQNVLAFVLLARTSPVTYSIASLVKRVAVICAAFLWFSQRVHLVQALGISMTFCGLYMYNNAVKKGDVDRGERKVRRVEKAWGGELPVSKDELESESEREGVEVRQVEMQSQMQQQVFARTMAQQHPPHPPRAASYSQTHPNAHPNLHIQITPHTPPPPSSASALAPPPPLSPLKSVVGKEKEERTTSPTESYPSPPPSLDSPPATSGVQAPWHAPVKKRRGTVSGHAHGHTAHAHTVEYGHGFLDSHAPRATMVAA